MKVELFLKNINQDTIDTRKLDRAGDWRVVVPIWRVKFMPPDLEKGQKYLIREEKEGGMLYDQKTSAIYKLDEEAYHILLAMQLAKLHFDDLGTLAQMLNVEKEKIEQLKTILGELNII